MAMNTSAVAFVVDITTSMSNALTAVKGSVKACLRSLRSNPGLTFVVVTFTESSQGSYVTVLEEADPDRLAARVDKVALGVDPGTKTHACGDDSPENTRHALCVAHDVLRGRRAVAFVITDAPPHFEVSNDCMSPSHRHENVKLRELGRPLDAYACLDSILAPYEGGAPGTAPMVLVPVVSNCCAWYHEMARRTGGVVLRLSDAAEMQHTWTAIVHFVLGTIVGADPKALQANVADIADHFANEPEGFVGGLKEEPPLGSECNPTDRSRGSAEPMPPAAAQSVMADFLEKLRMRFGTMDLEEDELSEGDPWAISSDEEGAPGAAVET